MNNLLSKLRAAAVKAGRSIGKTSVLQRLFGRTQVADAAIESWGPLSPAPAVVKSLIPRSHFTKRGPGVRANARMAFARMTSAQRDTARRMGWLR